MVTTTREVVIDGISFWFHDGNCIPRAVGITIPADADITSPEFISVYETAKEEYKDFERVSRIEVFMGQAYYSLSESDSDFSYWMNELEYAKEVCEIWGIDRTRIDQVLQHIEFANWKEKPKTEKPKAPPRKGFVYLIQSASGSFKIGRTSNPKKRISVLGVTLPFEIELVALIETPDIVNLETSLHELFADKRLQGEWFALTEEDVEYVKGLA